MIINGQVSKVESGGDGMPEILEGSFVHRTTGSYDARRVFKTYLSTTEINDMINSKMANFPDGTYSAKIAVTNSEAISTVSMQRISCTITKTNGVATSNITTSRTVYTVEQNISISSARDIYLTFLELSRIE